MWKSFYAEWEGGGQDAAPPTRACVCVYVYLPQRKWGKRGKKLLLSFHFSLSRFVNGEENERRSKESRGNTLLNSKKKKKKHWRLKRRTERNFKGTFNELPMPSRTVWRGLSKAEHKQRCLFFFSFPFFKCILCWCVSPSAIGSKYICSDERFFFFSSSLSTCCSDPKRKRAYNRRCRDAEVVLSVRCEGA